MTARSGTPARKIGVALLAAGLIATLAIPAQAAKPEAGFLTDDAPMITLGPGLPAGASVKAIISSGDELGDFMFEGLPDGIGIRPGEDKHTVDVYVVHEQTTVPFFGSHDFQDASVSRLTLTTKGGPNQASVLDADVALGPEEGFLRFCSASMGTPEQGLDDYVFFTGEEANDTIDGVQRGFNVVLNTRTGVHTAVPGMGRLNHENTMLIPGGWDDELVMLTTDDTFNAPSAQLYMYVADDQDAIFADEGTLKALRISGVDGVPLTDPTDAFNGANDYLDLDVGESFQGAFIDVPRAIAIGDQGDLEDWSNANNVFQAIRLEDLAFDKNDPRVVYIADTGRSRIIPDPATGRMQRGPGGTVGQADNGRIFKMVMNADDPMVVDSLTILADGDLEGTEVYVPFINPDNMDTSKKSLMIQEDTDDAKIWQHRFNQNSWRVVATVNDPDGESSGIVDASEWFGGGTWLLDVQGHGVNIDEDLLLDPPNLVKRESGQLMLLKVPAS
jgi:hypothetical protein